MNSSERLIPMIELKRYLADEQASMQFGAALAGVLRPGDSLWLHGTLGAGKTTLTRGLLRQLGHQGAVKSPTYTLVESYALPSAVVHHFDLYRIAEAGELEFLGLDEFFQPAAICVVEWAERGAGLLPSPTVELSLERSGAGRELTIKLDKNQTVLLDFLSKSRS